MTLEILIGTAVFLPLALVLFVVARRIPMFTWVHAAFFMTFIPFLELLHLVSHNDTKAFQLDLYAISYIVMAIYLLVFVFVSNTLVRFLPTDNTVIQMVMGVSDKALSGIFLAWVIQKAYLGVKYGLLGFGMLRASVEGVNEFRLDFLDTLLSVYMTHFAIGACVVFVVKAVVLKRRPTSMQFLPFILFALPYLVLGEAGIGARRFILLLGLIGGAAAIWQNGGNERGSWKYRMLVGSAAVVLALSFSIYFQSVRHNINDMEIASMISSTELAEVGRGVGLAMIPASDEGVEQEGASMLRESPFELIYDLIEKQFETGATTKGAITASSFEMIIPYIFAGPEKTSINVDRILVDELGIVPADGDITNVDIGSSVLVIFMADYGPIGMFLAPLFMVSAICGVLGCLRWIKMTTPLILLAISILFQISGNVEGDLLAVLTPIRELCAGIIVLGGADRGFSALKSTLLRQETIAPLNR